MRFLTLFLTVLLISLGYVSAHAQSDNKPVDGEDVAIAFYKTAGLIPNIESWIKKTKPYNLTPAARRPSVLQDEKNRVITKYNAFDPEEDTLVIQTTVTAIPTQTDLVDGDLYQLTLQFSNTPDVFYFPYAHAGNNFAVMPFGLRQVMEARINEDRYDFLKNNIKANKKYPLILRLRTKEAVTNRPYKLSGISQWILKSEIGSIELWSDKNALLWEDHAKWYVAPNLTKMNKLFDDQPDTRSKLGTVKSF